MLLFKKIINKNKKINTHSYYLDTEVRPEISVDTTRNEKLHITFDITFPHIGCAFLEVDSMDVSGEHQLDIAHGVYKKRLGADGTPVAEKPVREHVELGGAIPKGEDTGVPNCGSCYGAEKEPGQCCKTCDDVQAAYRERGWTLDPMVVEQCVREGLTKAMVEQQGEGCQVYGFVEVNKVAGNMHIAPGKSYQQGSFVHVHDTHMLDPHVNITHRVTRLAFGDPYPGVVNPLDEVVRVDKEGATMFQYFAKIVPTAYKYLDGRVLATNQYSVTEHSRRIDLKTEKGGMPGFFLMYDLSPVAIRFVEHRRSFAHFLTGVCAIVGGVFTVAGMIDRAIYTSMRSLQKKIDLGKAY